MVASQQTQPAAVPDPRKIVRVTGPEARAFLQGLVTNDIEKLADGPVYAALLSPQGKYLADFFMIADGESVLVDLPESLAGGIVQKLRLYKLRAAVDLEVTDITVTRGTGPMPEGAVIDPRDTEMGWRHYGSEAPETDADAEALETRRIALGIPAAGIELRPGDTYILEAGFERLNGVDFRKGCYVGQEIVARMKHKTELRKGLTRVHVDGAVPVGTEIMRDGKSVGTLYSQANGIGLAHLRFDRVGPGMTANEVTVRPFDAP